MKNQIEKNTEMVYSTDSENNGKQRIMKAVTFINSLQCREVAYFNEEDSWNTIRMTLIEYDHVSEGDIIDVRLITVEEMNEEIKDRKALERVVNQIASKVLSYFGIVY